MTTYERLLELMEISFQHEPFHTLNLVLEASFNHQVPGGTCSDKSLSFRRLAQEHGFDAYLHNAFIGGKDCHRLVRVELEGSVYFADVGNGWPAVIPYPAHEPIQYTVFGISFRSEITSDFISVFNNTGNGEKLMVKIPFNAKTEEEILHDIDHRFSEGTEYPFSGKVRFSAISGDEFLFLKGPSFRKYSSTGEHTIESVPEGEWPGIVESNFGWKIREV